MLYTWINELCRYLFTTLRIVLTSISYLILVMLLLEFYCVWILTRNYNLLLVMPGKQYQQVTNM